MKLSSAYPISPKNHKKIVRIGLCVARERRDDVAGLKLGSAHIANHSDFKWFGSGCLRGSKREGFGVALQARVARLIIVSRAGRESREDRQMVVTALFVVPIGRAIFGQAEIGRGNAVPHDGAVRLEVGLPHHRHAGTDALTRHRNVHLFRHNLGHARVHRSHLIVGAARIGQRAVGVAAVVFWIRAPATRGARPRCRARTLVARREQVAIGRPKLKRRIDSFVAVRQRAEAQPTSEHHQYHHGPRHRPQG
mmetsp:Transcript_86926/g.246317  ORF Transcript_86926/g.246317 Transcript_86926/m.246317 type:complete len:251 (+) Transcript_86926:1163-1915(+)